MQKKVGIRQQAMSRLEDPSYGKATLTTLKRIAAAFDVGLLVEFVPYSELVGRVSGMTPDTMNVPSFEEEETNGKFDQSERRAISFHEIERLITVPVGGSDPSADFMPRPVGEIKTRANRAGQRTRRNPRRHPRKGDTKGYVRTNTPAHQPAIAPTAERHTA